MSLACMCSWALGALGKGCLLGLSILSFGSLLGSLGSLVSWRRSALVVSVSHIGLIRGFGVGGGSLVPGLQLVGNRCLFCFFHLASVGCFSLVLQPPPYHVRVGDAYSGFLCLCLRCDNTVVAKCLSTRLHSLAWLPLLGLLQLHKPTSLSILRVCLGLLGLERWTLGVVCLPA